MRDFAHQIVYSAICSFFGVLQIVYSQDARMDFDAKYVKRCGAAVPRKDVPFGGRKTAILGPVFDGTWKFSVENAFNIGHLLSKRPLIVIVAP